MQLAAKHRPTEQLHKAVVLLTLTLGLVAIPSVAVKCHPHRPLSKPAPPDTTWSTFLLPTQFAGETSLLNLKDACLEHNYDLIRSAA